MKWHVLRPLWLAIGLIATILLFSIINKFAPSLRRDTGAD